MTSSASAPPVRVWLWQPEDLIDKACARLTPNLTEDEWEICLLGELYLETCPEWLGPKTEVVLKALEPPGRDKVRAGLGMLAEQAAKVQTDTS
jgi:hypothetical protein